MGRVGQSPQAARNEGNQFISSQICLAKRLAKMGFEGQSLRYLSRAMHTMQDSTSPAHFDFQPAWGDSFIFHLDHYISESLVLPNNSQLAQEQTRNAWSYYTGQSKMPSDFFKSNVYDSNFGPSFSPSTTSSSVSGGDCGCE